MKRTSESSKEKLKNSPTWPVLISVPGTKKKLCSSQRKAVATQGWKKRVFPLTSTVLIISLTAKSPLSRWISRELSWKLSRVQKKLSQNTNPSSTFVLITETRICSHCPLRLKSFMTAIKYISVSTLIFPPGRAIFTLSPEYPAEKENLPTKIGRLFFILSYTNIHAFSWWYISSP